MHFGWLSCCLTVMVVGPRDDSQIMVGAVQITLNDSPALVIMLDSLVFKHCAVLLSW